ncbi:lysosomal acid glucosylceramidase [Aplysia californica]|uniref:Glucosylceramidase n=1 Tax=Aplysia californica TaxID=6500 RepID=A0ABM0JYY3_APLCA|nr:lysosomal acid glucosylceramidase [Aplysia californica]
MAANVYVMLLFISSVLFVCIQSFQATSDVKCSLRSVSFEHKVCVCNSSYCDTTPTVEPVPKGQYIVFTTSRNGLRLDKKVLKAVNVSKSAVFKIDTKTRRQKIIGFGGAFTDAAGINIASLPSDAQKKLISSYFAKDGIEYTVGRVPMASCDFSTHPYSYDDVAGDLTLSKFALAPEDLKYKIPFIQQAKTLSPNPIRMFASPWSAPAWMKTNDNMTGKGSLIGEPGGQYYKAWALYYVKFLQFYQQHNISFWGLTTQNEPIDGLQQNFPFQALGFTPETQRDFVKLDLGPALHTAGFGNVSLMMLDDQRLLILDWTKVVLSDPEASQYLSGVAVHWYSDFLVPSDVLTKTHTNFPDKFIFASEACEGSMPWQKHVELGSWERAASYTKDIITDLNNWVTGWTDWNIALDMTGGPNWVSNFVDSPIIVNAEKKEFYKQPMFYALGHFSKFLRPGSVWVKVESSESIPGIEITAFYRPDNSLAVVIHNLGIDTVELTLTDDGSAFYPVTSPGYSIQTVLWW